MPTAEPQPAEPQPAVEDEPEPEAEPLTRGRVDEDEARDVESFGDPIAARSH